MAVPSMEEMRQIIQQLLAEHYSRRIKELVAKSTAAQSDAKHYQMIYEKLQNKHGLLVE